MQLGIFAKTFAPAPLEEILDVIVAHGLQAVHFNMVCVGLPAMPDEISAALCGQIRTAVAKRPLNLVGVSGTYNMIHPDPAKRAQGLRRLQTLIEACRPMGTDLVTLCTGTRDPENQWRFHPQNSTPEAWHDLTTEMAKALEMAEKHNVILGIEPELANVVDSAAQAEKLLKEMQSPHLKVIIDPANLFPAGTLTQQHQILDDAFDRLGDDIAIAHAKDLAQDGHAGDRAAGTGALDYGYYLHKLREIGFSGPLVMHGLTAAEVPQTTRFLQTALDLFPFKKIGRG